MIVSLFMSSCMDFPELVNQLTQHSVTNTKYTHVQMTPLIVLKPSHLSVH